ncbi:porin [Alkalimonas amylolytica]|uniref:Outer membrane protein (Porin) n=1 Tax=Alkalimonas amylolytica TaxID=152573 RepID=A0A1H4CJ20_ALKAM|nr:porin [Alkalimonas amylolytica]SEA60425.1 Outer membrane protein (porin) [Alkalimonas amylolytica]
MKQSVRSPLAAAIVMGLLVPVQAAEVSIYGRANLSVDQLDNGVNNATNVSSNSSRLGFRGQTELEHGLEAFFQIEQTIFFDEGRGNFADRDSFLGLRGNFGSLRLGQFDTPLKVIRARVDLFGNRIGDIRNLSRVNTGNDLIGNVFDERFKNGVAYQSPAVNNITFDLHYSPHHANGATNDNKREALSTAITYAAKGRYLSLAYERSEGNEVLNPTAWRLGAFYDVTEQLRLITFAQLDKDLPIGDRTLFGAGAAFKREHYTLKAQLYRVSNRDADDADATLLVVGIDRQFGRALVGYLAYAISSNEDNAAYRVSGGGRSTQQATVVGENASGLSLGLEYRF